MTFKNATRSPVVIVGLIIVVFCILQVISRSANLPWRYLEEVEMLTYDARLRLAFALQKHKHVAPNIGVLSLDDRAMEKVNNGSWAGAYAAATNEAGAQGRLWPWPRFIYGQVVRELAAQGALAIGFDIFFADRSADSSSQRVPIEGGGSLSSDEFFAAEMRKAGNVILVTEVSRLDATEMQGFTWTWPAQLLHTNAAGEGLGELQLESSGIIRRIKPFMTLGHDRVWNFGIALAAKALNINLQDAQIHEDRIVLRGADGLERNIPLDAGNLWIPWGIRFSDIKGGTTPIYSGDFGQLLMQDKLRRRETNLPAPFKGRVVLIMRAAGLERTISDLGSTVDLGLTPLEFQTPMAMAMLNVANSILTDRYVRRGRAATDCVFVLLMGIGAMGLAGNFRPVQASMASLLLAAVYIAAASAVFIQYLYWVPIVVPIGCALGATHVCILLERTDAMGIARRFFKHAGFKKVESLSSAELLLHPKEGEKFGLVARWTKETEKIPTSLAKTIEMVGRKHPGNLKLYLVYEGEGPGSKTTQAWREQLGCEIIPVLSAMLEKALVEQNYERLLHQLEEPYLIRADPYAEFKPIADPTWFYGRDDLMRVLPTALAQGQHVGIFGLRKVGKTSLANQLRQRFVATPAVLLDCQGLPAKAESYFEAICQELHGALTRQGIKRLPRLQKIADEERFTRFILALFTRWQQSGQREPFILILDEIDKFFPNPEIHGREEILSEYVRVFRVIRGLAQSRQCLVTCVIAYRPVVNRQNLLTASVGENPMFNSLHEVFLGFLNAADSAAMVREIGLWKKHYLGKKVRRSGYSSFAGGTRSLPGISRATRAREGRY